MFLSNIKNIYVGLKTNNPNKFNNAFKQIGGNKPFIELLDEFIKPKLEQLKIKEDSSIAMYKILELIQWYLSKVDPNKFKDIDKFNEMIEEIKTILDKRIGKI